MGAAHHFLQGPIHHIILTMDTILMDNILIIINAILIGHILIIINAILIDHILIIINAIHMVLFMDKIFIVAHHMELIILHIVINHALIHLLALCMNKVNHLHKNQHTLISYLILAVLAVLPSNRTAF